jgi:hypothetical protein
MSVIRLSQLDELKPPSLDNSHFHTYFQGIRYVPVETNGEIVEVPLIGIDELGMVDKKSIESIPLQPVVQQAQQRGIRFVSSLSGRTLPPVTGETQLHLFTLANRERVAVFGVREGDRLRV